MHKSINKLAWFVSLSLVQLLAPLAWAEGVAPAVPSGGSVAAGLPGRPSIFETLMPFILMFGVMYFLILRPQQKKLKEQQQMLANLTDGDEVVTSAGIFGRIRALDDKVITLEVADNVRMRVLRSQIAQKVSANLKA